MISNKNAKKDIFIIGDSFQKDLALKYLNIKLLLILYSYTKIEKNQLIAYIILNKNTKRIF